MRSFKIKIVWIFFLLFQTQLLIGKEPAQFNPSFYHVAAENIVIGNDGFLITGGESLILVKSLFHDADGFFFLDTEETGWICNWCGTINPLDASSCKRCGESYGSGPSKKK